MRKVISILLLLLTFTLTGCGNNELSLIEKEIREYDYYTEIVDFEDYSYHVKFMVAYDEDSSLLHYIYYFDNVGTDLEVLIKINDEIIYEDFLVISYIENNEYLGKFTTHSLGIDEVTKATFHVVNPGWHDIESFKGSLIMQEFNLLPDNSELDPLERYFVSTEDYIDKPIEIAEINIVATKTFNTFLVFFGISSVLYVASIYIYKRYYSKKLNQAVHNDKKTKIMELQVFKYVSLIACLVIVISATIISSRVIVSSYKKVDLYSDNDIQYEEAIGDNLNLMFGTIEKYGTNNQVMFLNKRTGSRFMGYLILSLESEYDNKVYINRPGSFYEYKLTFRFIDIESYKVEVKDYKMIDNDPNNYEFKTYFERYIELRRIR